MTSKVYINDARYVMRNDTTENWESENPVLLKGERGIEFTADGEIKEKIGDGASAWNDLEYFIHKTSNLVNDGDGESPFATEAQISVKANESDLSAVAKSGDYSDLKGIPSIPSVDKIYTPDSENAQSGKAVAAAINSIPNPSWHNIETITTTEALGTITRKFGSLNGEITYPNAAKVSKIQVYLTIPPNADATATRLECRISDTNSTRIFMWDYISTTDTKIGWILLERHAKWVPTFSAAQARSASSPNTSAVLTYTCSADNLMVMGTENVRYLSFHGQLPAGTVIDIWGYYDEG